MATFLQPLTSSVGQFLSSCPYCRQRQAQSAGPQPRERAQAHPPAADSGQADLSSAQPDDMMYPTREEH
jgi:hypothetical protein